VNQTRAKTRAVTHLLALRAGIVTPSRAVFKNMWSRGSWEGDSRKRKDARRGRKSAECVENPVAGVTETWNDVLLVVQVAVNRTRVDRDIRVVCCQAFDTFRSGND